ncbi:hypothetical protein BDQ12DRAFT_715672 [Crucibulum laeve]|uniref:F-box domain-containing protein n=1 Tax=Crucibulum laeve TaxID=68775 RepID=A0A5C3LMC8_9AGAR|nr:hypothetical protein BDQ12DRAFT_715672 [Crucibulum laeve]
MDTIVHLRPSYCVHGEETTLTVLRKFAFLALERLEITNIDTPESKKTKRELPVLPRLESISRNPSPPHLTELTLANFAISSEQGRAVLGYVPVLTSLTFDACIGVGRMMEGLQEMLIGTISTLRGGDSQVRRGGKTCPRLEALTFWGCHDLDFSCARVVVLVRNRKADTVDEEFQQGKDWGPNGADTVVTGESSRPGLRGTEIAEVSVMGRKIKPLRKLRHQGQGNPTCALEISSSPRTAMPYINIVSELIATQEEFQPVCINYLHVEDCELIGEEDTPSLKGLGVVDVVWDGVA